MNRNSVLIFMSTTAFAFCAVRAETPPVFTPQGKVIVQGQEYEIYPAELMRAKGLTVPEVPVEQNAAWVHIQAINALKPLPESLTESFDTAMGGQWPEGEKGDQLRAWIDENRPALELARQASTMPQYYMPFFRGESDALIAALLPTLGHSRQIAKIFAADATYQISQGRADAAVENLLTTQRIAHQIGNGKTLIEGLVGVACGNLADLGMTRLAESGAVDAEVLKSALTEMRSLRESVPDFETMIRGEQEWAGSFVDDMLDMEGGLPMALSGFTNLPPRQEPTGWTRLVGALSRVYYPDRAVKRHFNEHYDAMIRSTRREDGTVGEIIDEEQLFARVPAWDFMSRMILPSVSRAYEMSLQGESNFVRAQVSIAVAAYQKEKGVAPPALSALVPDYLPEVPADPMTGYDFDYSPAGPDGRPQGISQVTRESAEELRKKRRTPAILSPRASKWRRFVMSYATRHEFTDAQRASAEAILRDMEARAGAFERSFGARIQDLIEQGDTQAAKEKTGPLDDLFNELKKRLDTLPSAKQREAAKSNSKERTNS